MLGFNIITVSWLFDLIKFVFVYLFLSDRSSMASWDWPNGGRIKMGYDLGIFNNYILYM